MIVNENSEKRTLRNVDISGSVQWHDFVNAYDCKVGNGTKIGAFVEIQKDAVIGERCKISSHSFICEGVKIGNGVFIGHNVSFINTKWPRAVRPDGSMRERGDWELLPTVVEDGASVGTGATIMGNVTIGRHAVIGAGAVVLHDVAPYAVAAGNPAKIIKYVHNSDEIVW